MDIRKLQSAIVDALEDIKAQDIVVLDTRHLTSLFDRIILASGTSNRQTRSLAMSVRDKVKRLGGEVIAIEGLETGEWVLVDCNAIVVHIMQPMIRDYYKLEQLWGDKPTHITSHSRSSLEVQGESKRTAKKPYDLRSAVPGNQKKPISRTATKKTPAKTTPTKKRTAATDKSK